MSELHPLDAGLLEYGQPVSGLAFPPCGWRFIGRWGDGYSLDNYSGLRMLIDCSMKSDGKWWVHVSVSRKDRAPSHADMCSVKDAFLGVRYAYSVWPPPEKYVNIHPNCLHLWACCEGTGRALPEFSETVDGVGLSI